MEPSTLLPSDLRRRTLVTMANANMSSPLRRSMNTSIMNSSAVVMMNGEDERADRRNQLQIQKRLSTISSPMTVNFNESFIKEQFVIYTQLFTENKITARNAWDLHIIDMLRSLCQNPRQDVLQRASTSIEISAKVYGVRVDDVHSQGLRLANNMARVAETAPLCENDDEGNYSEGQQEAVTKKKKKRTLNQTEAKRTINRNPKGNLAKLPKLEPADFTTRVKSDYGTVGNLFTNILKETPNSFILLDKPSNFIEPFDPTLQDDIKVSLRNIRLPEKLGSINPAFNDFTVDTWDPEEEEKQLNEEKSLLSQTEPLVFDDDGFPIPELVGSIHDIFENNEADVDMDNDIEITEVQQRHLRRSEMRGSVANIFDSRPMGSPRQSSEYSFNPVIKTSSGKYLDQIWAGPSHWKLKCIRRSTPRCSGQNKTTKVPQKRRNKNQEEQMIDFDSEPTIDFSKRLIIRKRPLVDINMINKITLPLMDEACARIITTAKEFMLKPGVCPGKRKKKPTSDVQEDFEVSPHENPNDSMYCSQSQFQNHDGDGHVDDNRDMDDNIVADEENDVPHTGNLAENLIDNPEQVPSTYIQYASKTKPIDMKKLKGAIWHKLTTDPETQEHHDKVVPQNFSEIYKALPGILPSKEKEKLSCPLAFVALLHVASEQNLDLKPLEGNKDCHIQGPED